MARRIEVIRTPYSVVAPVNDIPAAEWTQVRDAGSRVFDTRTYGTVQAAIDAASGAGGGTVFVGENPPVGEDWVLRDGVYLVGRGSGATEATINTIRGEGSLSALPAIAGSIPRHSRSVTFAGAPDLAPGDVFIITDSTDSSFNTARAYYRAGEFCRVESVSGSTVNLTAPTYAAYTASASITAHKMNPIRTGVSGMTIRCTTGTTGVMVTLGTDLVFRDLVMSGTDHSHLTLLRCYNVTIDGVKAFDAQSAVGLNYGISLGNCQRIRLNHVDLETRRHGLSLGGDGVTVTGSVPNRDVQVNDSYISGMSDGQGVTGCNLHGNCEFITFDNVRMPAGFNPSGDYLTVRNCEIGSSRAGSCLSSMEMLGTNHTYEGNIFRANANHLSARGMCYVLLEKDCVRTGGIMRFANNLFDLGTYTGDAVATIALYVLVTHDNVSANRIDIRGNRFQASGTLTEAHYGPWVRSVVTSSGFSEVALIDNTGNLKHRTDGTAAPFFEGSGTGAPAFVAAKGSRYMQRDGGAGTTLYVNETGTATWRAV